MTERQEANKKWTLPIILDNDNTLKGCTWDTIYQGVGALTQESCDSLITIPHNNNTNNITTTANTITVDTTTHVNTTCIKTNNVNIMAIIANMNPIPPWYYMLTKHSRHPTSGRAVKSDDFHLFIIKYANGDVANALMEDVD
jgi:hypothetical protein